MWLQTYYKLDPWSFEPPVSEFSPIRTILSQEKFSLCLSYIHGRENQHDPCLLIRTLLVCEDVADELMAIFRGETTNCLDFSSGDGFHCYPPSYREFIQDSHSKMDQWSTDVFNVVRWRLGINGGPLALKSEWQSMRWSSSVSISEAFNENSFLEQQIPVGVTEIKLPETQSILSHEHSDAVKDLSKLTTPQPLYHDIFREAWQSRKQNARSALVMAIAAAETGFKTMVADLYRDRGIQWVFENMPSPPLDRMLREFFELLPTRRRINDLVKRPPKSVITALKNGIELRNKLVHGRDQAITSETLDGILFAVRDLLYLFDFYRGHDWALSRTRPEFTAAMKGSDP
jgi:hypothetical protein